MAESKEELYSLEELGYEPLGTLEDDDDSPSDSEEQQEVNTTAEKEEEEASLSAAEDEKSTEGIEKENTSIKGTKLKLNLKFDGSAGVSQAKGGLSASSGAVIGSLLSDHDDSRLNEAYAGLGNGAILRDEDWGIWRVYYAVRTNVFKPDKEFIVGFLNRNRELIHSADGRNITLKDYEPVAGDNIAGYIAAVARRYEVLYDKYKTQTYEEYRKALEVYKLQYKTVETNRVLQTALDINGDGVKVGRKYLQGSEASFGYVRDGMAAIGSVTGDGQGVVRKSMKDVLSDVASGDQTPPYKVCDFAGIPSLNKVMDGIWTSNLYSILAPPKAGKTKFCSRICHSAIMAGKNVTVWPVEGGDVEWTAQQRAIHFDYFHNAGKDPADWVSGITQDVILKNKFASDSVRRLEQVSRSDLLNNESYGSIDFVEGEFSEDTFLDKIKVSVDYNNSSLVIIDYMQWISAAKGSKKAKWEAIQDSYKELAKFATSENLAIVSPAQFTQEAIKGLIKSGADSGAGDLRTASGGSAEVVRASDIIFGLWATTQDLENNYMQIISVPSRKVNVFPNISLGINLGTCQFIELAKDSAE